RPPPIPVIPEFPTAAPPPFPSPCLRIAAPATPRPATSAALYSAKVVSLMVRTIRKTKSKKTKKVEASSSSNPAVASGPAKVWQPGVDALEDGEELQFDPEAYNYLRGFSIGWSCLSFDVVRDQLGLVRSEFPHTFYGVAGTQVALLFIPSKPRHLLAKLEFMPIT
ncbi:unnamed protein product, partial [Urochloa humidicola]